MSHQPVKSAQTGADASVQLSSKSEKCPPLPRNSPMSLLTDHDLYLFNEGSHVQLYERLGAHTRTLDGAQGTNFAVWAPDAEAVYVMGNFNGWNKAGHRLHPLGQSGIWETFVPNLGKGESYKY